MGRIPYQISPQKWLICDPLRESKDTVNFFNSTFSHIRHWHISLSTYIIEGDNDYEHVGTIFSSNTLNVFQINSCYLNEKVP